MNLTYPAKIAYQNLMAAKLRSFLTILGIIIGVSAVIVVMAVGTGAQKLILDQITGLGSNLVGVLPGASSETGPPAQAFGITITTFKYKDFLAVLDKNNVPEVETGAAYVTANETVAYQNTEKTISVIGTTHQYAEVQDAEIEGGRFFYSAENTNLARSAVLGSKIKEDYFGAGDPTGKTLKIGKENFTVVGYFRQKGSTGFGVASQDDAVFVPLFSAQKILLGIDYLSFARFKVGDARQLESAKVRIEETMRQQHGIKDPSNDDFSVRDLASALELISTVTNVLKYFLTLIAAISLIVGGVGIMNIMLIAVNQRIREIGLRKAVGARKINIIAQFIAESVTITVIGGTLGIILGVIVSFLISVGAKLFGYDWPFVVQASAIFIGFGVSFFIGIIFGLYPALKAAKISPIEALRYE